MSKKSRKKQKAESASPEPLEVPAAETDVATPPDDAVTDTEVSAAVEVSELSEVLEAVEDSGGESPAGDEELPEGVSRDTLSGDLPSGEAPRLSLIIEAILFASQKAVTPKELVAHLRNAAAAEPNSVAVAFARIRENSVLEALTELQAEVAAAGRAYQVRETATGWLLSSAPGYAPWLRALYPEVKPTRLSPSALETLAIIAYRQPIARADMEAVRGVSVDGVMQTLLDRGLVKIAGRAEVAGRPLLYATTQYFLDHFGLRHLDELPNAAELRHIPLPKGTPEPDAQEGAADAPELPGVSGEGSENSGSAESEADSRESAEAELPTVEVSEIIEVRESVVFEEVVFDPENPGEPVTDSGESHSESGGEK